MASSTWTFGGEEEEESTSQIESSLAVTQIDELGGVQRFKTDKEFSLPVKLMRNTTETERILIVLLHFETVLQTRTLALLLLL